MSEICLLTQLLLANHNCKALTSAKFIMMAHHSLSCGPMHYAIDLLAVAAYFLARPAWQQPHKIPNSSNKNKPTHSTICEIE
jgi:hypothetical protein